MAGAAAAGSHTDIAFAVRRAIARAGALSVVSEELCRSSAELRHEARLLRRRPGREDGLSRRPDPDPLVPEAAGFHLLGVVDGARVTAEWTAGRLVASESLLVRADLVVRLGERFGGFDNDAAIPAGLDGGPTRALLTCMRACDQIEGVCVRLDPTSRTGGEVGQPDEIGWYPAPPA